MRSLLHIIILVAFVLYAESTAVMWGLYALFDDDVAAYFCENSSNPACHGRCHVVKTTSKAENDRARGPEIDLPKTLPFIATSTTIVVVSSVVHATGVLSDPLLSAGFPTPIYHPPVHLS